MFWLPGVVVAVIAISIAALLLLARSTCPEEWERISELLWLIWCWIYTIRWRMRFAWRTATGQTAGGFLFFASLYVVLELTLAVVSALTEEAGGPPVRIPYIPHVPRIARLPLWAELVVILVAILVLRHHWREWNIKVRESHVPESLHNLITQCRRYLRKPDLNSNRSLRQRLDFFILSHLSSGRLAAGHDEGVIDSLPIFLVADRIDRAQLGEQPVDERT
jgi:hypothetical protein